MVAKLREDVEMIKELCPKFDLDAYLCGSMTPVFFGSAINNFGVREVLEGLCAMAPAPRPHPAVERLVAPEENKVSGFILKFRPIWIRNIVTASPLCVFVPAISNGE